VTLAWVAVRNNGSAEKGHTEVKSDAELKIPLLATVASNVGRK
jgi:hypothetical protein